MNRLVAALLSVLFMSLTAAGPARSESPWTPADMEFFFGGQMPALLENHGIPGAVVSVVKDGQLLWAKGYGWANLEKRKPVSAERTLFHVGSITKLCTWTAVMQLVEQSRIYLDMDVNTYLKRAKVPDAFGQPVTMRHLMTHTPGFDDRLANLFTFKAENLIPLEDYAIREMPARVYPPGEVVAYSNFGAALAGLIVQDVSGMPYEKYIERNILQPLGMAKSTIRQPVRRALAGDESWGYFQSDGGPEPVREYITIPPAGGLSASATDMARFMIAHLEGGRLGDARILKEETVRMMHSTQVSADPRLPGITLGFLEWRLNGQRIIRHPGGTTSFMSLMLLLPKHKLGLFISFNGSRGTEAVTTIRQAFLDRFFPYKATAPQPMTGYKERTARYVGEYRQTRFSHQATDKLLHEVIFGRTVTARPDGLIDFLDRTWIEVEPGFFRENEGQGILIFQSDPNGRPVRAFQNIEPQDGYFRKAWYENNRLHQIVFIGCNLVFLLVMVSGLVGAVLRRASGKTQDSQGWAVQARRLALAVSGLHLLFPVLVVGLGLWVTIRSGNPGLTDGFTDILQASLIPPLFGAVLTIGAAPLAFLAWKDRYWSVRGRIFYTLFTLAALLFVWWLNYWNLLGAGR